MMTTAFLLAAAGPVPGAPVLSYAESRSASYRDCVAAASRQAPAGASAAEIGEHYCAPGRMALRAAIRSHVSERWSELPRSAAQARRIAARIDVSVAGTLAGYDAELTAWLAGGGAATLDEGAQPPIDIPYQIMPAFQVYTACVSDRLNGDPRFGAADAQAARQANLDALAGCREVRAQQLARALELQTDNRVYGSPANAQAAVRRAFDRFDSDYRVESATDSGAPKQ